MIYRQLLLDLHRSQIPSFDNFVPGANAELLERLRQLAEPQETDALYLWGPAGSGRSHLLRATASTAVAEPGRPVVAYRGEDLPDALELPRGALLIVDDIDRLSPAAQITLFRLYNSARLGGYGLLLSGPQPPQALALREDLRTRVGQCLIFSLQPLTDEEKAAALQRHAERRSMRLEEAVVQYLLRHGRRDLPSLLAAVDALDHASLELKRPPTLPLLREVLDAVESEGTSHSE